MLKETEGRGAYCSLVMAVIVVKDVVTFLGFAINIELLQAVSAYHLFLAVGCMPLQNT